MKFQAQLNSTEPLKWFCVFADSEEEAAYQALRLAAARRITTIDKLLPCSVYVSDSNIIDKHADGTPWVVRRFDFIAR